TSIIDRSWTRAKGTLINPSVRPRSGRGQAQRSGAPESRTAAGYWIPACAGMTTLKLIGVPYLGAYSKALGIVCLLVWKRTGGGARTRGTACAMMSDAIPGAEVRA